MPLDAVFFDLDGTLLDTALDLSEALNMIRAEDHLPAMPHADIREHVSNGAYALIKKGYAIERGDARMPELRRRLLACYLQNIARKTKPFPGTEALIATLSKHDIPWGVVTNKPRDYTEPLMQHFTWATEPCCILSPEDVSKPKPDPEALLLACEHARCRPNNAMYIGDHKRDIECGKRAGMTTIAVSYGYLVREDNIHSWGAAHVAHDAAHIWPILQTYL